MIILLSLTNMKYKTKKIEVWIEIKLKFCTTLKTVIAEIINLYIYLFMITHWISSSSSNSSSSSIIVSISINFTF